MKKSDASVSPRKRTLTAATAYHEAGHAVAALWLNRPIRKVTIVPEGSAAGYVQHKRKERSIDQRAIFDESTFEHFADILITYAGQLAQKRFAPRSWRPEQTTTGTTSGKADDDQMMGLALCFTDAKGAELLLDWLRHEAKCLVERRWREIEAVAAALLERKTLSGDEVRAVIDKMYGLQPLRYDKAREYLSKKQKPRTR